MFPSLMALASRKICGNDTDDKNIETQREKGTKSLINNFTAVDVYMDCLGALKKISKRMVEDEKVMLWKKKNGKTQVG